MYDLHPFAQRFEELVENSVELKSIIYGVMVDDEKQCIIYEFDGVFTGMIFWDERNQLWRDMGDRSVDAFSAQEIRRLEGYNFKTIEEVVKSMIQDPYYFMK